MCARLKRALAIKLWVYYLIAVFPSSALANKLRKAAVICLDVGSKSQSSSTSIVRVRVVDDRLPSTRHTCNGGRGQENDCAVYGWRRVGAANKSPAS